MKRQLKPAAKKPERPKKLLDPDSVIVIPTCSHSTVSTTDEVRTSQIRLQQVQTRSSVVEEIVASYPPAPPCMTEKGVSILCTLKEPPPSWTRILYAYSSCSYRLRNWISTLWTQTGNISITILAGDTKSWNGAKTLHSTAYFVFCNPLLHPLLVPHTLHPQYNSHSPRNYLDQIAFRTWRKFHRNIPCLCTRRPIARLRSRNLGH